MSIVDNKPSRWLRLVSPYIKGKDVEALQAGINKRRAARNQHPIRVDGEYGPATRDAVRSILWYLGCPADEMDAGATLKAQYAIRDPEGHRPKDWETIAADRKAWLSEQDTGAKGFLHIIEGYLGKHEDAGRQNRADWLDPLLQQVGFSPATAPPYCAIGLIACFRKAGLDAVRNSWAFTPAWLRDGRDGDMGWKSVAVASRKPGDIGFIKIPGVSTNSCDHVYTMDDDIDFTNEFNTSPGNGGSQNNGGGVYRRAFHDRIGMTVGMLRPPWGS
jgi:hypothetical protein